MTDAIVFSRVQYRAGKDFSLRDLSLRVPTGAIYGLIGPNGAGKTTTIRLLTGVLRATKGSVSVLGHTMPNAAPRALAEVGYVPERLHLYPGLAVEQCLELHAAFYPTWDRKRAHELLGEFALRPRQVVSQLSKGESGKLMMLLALSQRPRLLVLDEPTDGLDPVARRDVMSAVMASVADFGATVLITSHLVHEVERMCDWIGLLDDGMLVREEPLAAFRDHLRVLRVADAPANITDLGFTVLSRRPSGARAEEWTVRDFDAESERALVARGATLLDARPLDLEDTVVELLRAARLARGGTN